MPPRIKDVLRFHGHPFKVWHLSDGSHSFDFKEGGRRRVVNRKNFDDLRAEAERIALSIVNANSAMKDMTAEDYRIYILSREIVGRFGLAVDEAARILARALQTGIAPDEIEAACQERQSSKPRRIIAQPTAQIVAELIAHLTDKGRSAKYLVALRRDMSSFATAHPKLDGLDEQAIAGYLRALKAGPRRRDNVRDAIVTLCRFARSRHYLPDDQRTAAEKIERINPGVEVETWSPHELALLIEHVSDRWRPWLAIGAFAGLRTSEIFRLEWRAVKWEQRVISVSSKVAKKVRVSRIVPMSDNLLAWLAPWRDAVGPIYPNRETHRIGPAWTTLEHHHGDEIRRLAKLTGIRWSENALRHSFGSYRLALVKNIAQVAMEMGNSPEKVREHYHDPKSEDEAKAYFSVQPPEAGANILPLPLEFR